MDSRPRTYYRFDKLGLRAGERADYGSDRTCPKCGRTALPYDGAECPRCGTAYEAEEPAE